MSLRGSIKPGSARGTVSLVALCFVAVLGISLAGYIAVCTRAMTLSNRSFQANLGQQLAELGLEEALRAFNKNDWGGWASNPTGFTGATTAWNLDATNKRATRTLTLSSSKLGQGTTATIKIRVDNYDAAVLGTTWNSSTNYRLNDRVGRNGLWYRCVQANSNQTPNGMVNLAYWVPEPIGSVWDSSITYKVQDVVFHTTTNTWYRCILAPTTNQAPTNTSYWTSISRITIDNGYVGSAREVLNYFGTWYYYQSGWRSTPNPPNSYNPIISWVWRSNSYSYAFNDLVCYGYPAVWYRCKLAHTSSSSILPTNTTYWENALTGMWGWNSGGVSYQVGDSVYSSTTSQWYRCIRAHTSSATITPSSTTYWSNTPGFSNEWTSLRSYSQNDTVLYNGVWYLSLQNSNVGQPPTTATTYWIGADTTSASYLWNSSTNYAAGAYCCYGGVWYKCSTAHTNQSPNNTSYWSSAWTNSFNITTGTPVAYAEASISIGGSPAVKTQLRAVLSPAPLFPNAAGATTDLTITTGTGTVDSYDSEVTAYAAASAGYSAVLAAGTTLAINGTTDVKGYLAWPSPPSGISTDTTVKSATSPASPKVDKSRVSRSPFIPQFDALPSGGLVSTWSSLHKGTSLDGVLGVATTLNLGTPGATTPSRYYLSGDLEIGTVATTTTININGPVILYIKGYLRMRGGSNFYINGTGSAEIHVGTHLYLESGAFTNRAPTAANPDPKNLIVICDTASSNTQTYAYSPSSFHGVIYMPKTTATAGLSISSGIQIYGALSAREITFSSEANLHYDTSLRYATIPGVDQPYAVTEWRELPVTEQATMP